MSRFLFLSSNADTRSGSPVKHILITEAVTQRKQAPIYMTRGQQHKFHTLIAQEEEEWEQRQQQARPPEPTRPTGGIQSFEEYRQKAQAAGFV